MKNLFTIITAMLIGVTAVSAQTEDQDPKAKKYLDALSAKSKKYTTLTAEFESRIFKEGEIDIKQSGKIQIQDQKYRLTLNGDNTVIFDGKAIYAITDCECTISDAPEPGEYDIDPTKIFTIYEDKFKYQLREEKKMDGRNVAVIYLYPMDAKKAPFHTIVLTVDKDKMEPYIIEVKSREGNNYTYKISKYTPNLEIAASKFKFSRALFPCVEEVVDMRDE